MLNLKDMMDIYQEEGFASDLAAARVCQDIVLTAISKGPLSRNVTINEENPYCVLITSDADIS